MGTYIHTYTYMPLLSERSSTLIHFNRFLPLVPFSSTPVRHHPDSIAQGESTSLALLSILEGHLSTESSASAPRSFLLGEKITVADVMVAVYVARGLEWVLGRSWREEHPRVMEHWRRVCEWGPVREVVGDRWVLCEEEGEG